MSVSELELILSGVERDISTSGKELGEADAPSCGDVLLESTEDSLKRSDGVEPEEPTESAEFEGEKPWFAEAYTWFVFGLEGEGEEGICCGCCGGGFG